MPFTTTTPRFFVFSVQGGSEPNLKITVARLLASNNTDPEAMASPKEVLVGINRCPEPSCAGKGSNSVSPRLESKANLLAPMQRNTKCGYDAKDEPSLRGEGIIRSIATPDGDYCAFSSGPCTRCFILRSLQTSCSNHAVRRPQS